MPREAKNRRNTWCISRFFNEAGRKICRQDVCGDLFSASLKHLVKRTRTNAGRKESPSYAIIDSQSVKTVAASEERGIDGGKKRKAESGTS